MLEKNPTLALSPPEPKQSEDQHAAGDAIHHQYQDGSRPNLQHSSPLSKVLKPQCTGEHHESFTWPKPYGCDPCSWVLRCPLQLFAHTVWGQKFVLKRNQKLLLLLTLVHTLAPPRKPFQGPTINCVMQTNDIVILFLKIVRIDV